MHCKPYKVNNTGVAMRVGYCPILMFIPSQNFDLRLARMVYF